MLISVIITTYNWPDALNLVLSSFMDQIDKNFELLIADDGSTIETKTKILYWCKKFKPNQLIHVWQEDQGFRASRVRNLAAKQAKGDYLIFIDGDCIVKNDFIMHHRKLAENKYFVVGHRVLLKQNYTKQILLNNQQIHKYKFFDWLYNCIFNQACNRFLPLLPIYWPSLFRYLNKKKWRNAKGCNLGIWKQDLFAVNGWEENYQGWGYEDSDLVIRLLRLGVNRKSGRFAVPVLHLWHKENDRSQTQDNLLKLNKILNSNKILAEYGLQNN